MKKKDYKVITMCGSLKFKDEMIRKAFELELEGNIVLMPIFPVSDKDTFTEKEVGIFGIMHKERIKLSDAIFVMNVDHYIGNTTKGEILFATENNKEVLYLEEV